MPSHIQKVQEYYQSTAFDYKTLWTGKDDLAVHFGYYDESTTSHSASLLKMNEVLADLVDITNKDMVLDAGCGYGGSSIWLAKNRGCRMIGITIVPQQVNEGKKLIKKLGLSQSVQLEYQDYTHTSFPNASFDVIWGLESFVHAKQKKLLCEEAYRLLRKRGRIVIAEYMLREDPPLSKNEKATLQPWLDGWAIPGLLTPKLYQTILRKAGFKQIQIHDITIHTKPSLRRLEKMSTLSLPLAKIFHKTKLFNTARYGNIKASYYQSKALHMNAWNYVVITAKK